MNFTLSKGTNISHWLSQSDLRGEDRKRQFTREDVNKISDFGLDHVRIPVDEVQLWDSKGIKENEAFDLLNEGIYWCKNQNIRCIVDMHILRSHYFEDIEQPKLYSDEKELLRFAQLWQDLSFSIKEWPIDFVAYEILNEPKAQDPNDWNRVSSFIIEKLRNLEKERVLVLGSNWYCKAHTFPDLFIPEDENLILTFHYYDPMLVTHYRANWLDFGFYDGPIVYPGEIVNKTEIQKFKDPQKKIIERENCTFKKEYINEKLHTPLEIAKKNNKKLYCGEFGCIINTPYEMRKKWYQDVVSCFKGNNISYANWEYRGEFGIFDTNNTDTDIVKLLM